MIKILLVDDEIWNRKSLQDQVNWRSLGIEISGEAKNGVVALEMIRQDQPSIVITDIRMPMMDGIQLMEILHTEFPHILIIILSGYAEFEYAKKAIYFQAFDYVLKPIDTDQLEATLKRAVAVLRENELKHDDILQLTQKVNESGSLSKEKFLTNLIIGSDLSEEEINHLVRKKGFQFHWPRMVILIIKAENFDEIAELKYKHDRELTSFVLANVIGELFQNYEDSIIFRNFTRQKELILIKGFATDNDRVIIEEIYEKCQTVIHTVREITKFELYIGIGREFTHIKDARHSYTQALEAVHNSGIVHTNRIIHIDEVSSRIDYYIYPDNKEKALIYYLGNGYKPQANQLIEELFSELSDSKTIHPQSIRNTVLELTFSMNKLLKKHHMMLENLLNEPNIPDKIMNEFFTIKELKEWLKEISTEVIDFVSGSKKTGLKKTVLELISYLDQHYSNELTLYGVAETLFINPVYLSRIFKNETGMTFNDYINKLRMEAALKLLKDNNLTMNDVSEMIGYGNTSYFLKKFKEFYGCTPTEYRKKQS